MTITVTAVGQPDGSVLSVSSEIGVWKTPDPICITDYGAVGDGVTDDSSAIVEVATLGKRVYFPSGTYKCTTFSITLAANTQFIGAGQGNTVIAFTSSTTTSKVDFITTGNNSFEDLTLYHDGIASETAQIVSLSGSGITFLNCEITSNDAVDVNTSTNAFVFTNSDVDHFGVIGCHLHNLNRVILKANASDAIASVILFSNNYIHDLGEGGVQFNFPVGTITGVRIIGNHFENFYSGTEQIFCGGASVNNLVVAGNVFQGTGNECLHLEEKGRNITITGNVFNIAGDGIVILDNNVGDGVTYEQPKHITITGNTFINGGSAGAYYGIDAHEYATGIDSFNHLSVIGNTFRYYEYGVWVGYGAAIIKQNMFEDCTSGLRTNDARPDIDGNTFTNCTTAINASTFTGLIGNNTFVNCSSALNTVLEDTTKASMTGWKIVLQDDVAIPTGGVTSIPLGISIGAEMYGQIKFVAYMNASQYIHRLSTLVYDGSTIADTELMITDSGSVAVAATAFESVGGVLSLRLSNLSGTNTTLKYLTAQFDGMWTSSD
jgi:hypothetical protein